MGNSWPGGSGDHEFASYSGFLIDYADHIWLVLWRILVIVEIKHISRLTWGDLPKVESPFFARAEIERDRSVMASFGIPRINGLNEALRGYGYGYSSHGAQIGSHETFDWLLNQVDEGEFVLVNTGRTTPMKSVLRWSTEDNRNGYRVPLRRGKIADYTQGRWRVDPDLPMRMRSRIDRCLEEARRSDSGPEHLWWGGVLESRRGGGGGDGAMYESDDEITAAKPGNRRRGRGTPSTTGTPSANTSLSKAADLATPATPANAPATINLSGMQNDFNTQWNNSFPSGVSQERGGTLVSDTSGNLSMVNVGGGTSGQFSPNLNVSSGKTVQGVFHTHPYDASEGGHTGVSLSGGDAAYAINNNHSVIVAQSGSNQFMYMRTAASPANVNAVQLNNAQNARIAELQTVNGKSFAEASRIAAKETAQANGLAYYEGSNGILQRVYP